MIGWRLHDLVCVTGRIGFVDGSIDRGKCRGWAVPGMESGKYRFEFLRLTSTMVSSLVHKLADGMVDRS